MSTASTAMAARESTDTDLRNGKLARSFAQGCDWRAIDRGKRRARSSFASAHAGRFALRPAAVNQNVLRLVQVYVMLAASRPRR
jgi:hypothetical protein